MQAHDDTTGDTTGDKSQATGGDALWRTIAADLRSAILDRRYLPGAALPSEPELVRRYQVSRPTVRKAIDTLVSEGLAYVLRGRGSFVRPQLSRHIIMTTDGDRPDLAAPAYHPDVRAYGWKLAQREWATDPFDSTRTTANRHIATMLAVKAGHGIIHRHSRWSFEFGARVEINSYTDAELVPDYDDPKRSAQYRKRATLFYQTLQRGRGPISWSTTTAARLAYESDRLVLAMEFPDPILVITRAMMTQHGRIMECTEIKAPANHFEVASLTEAANLRTIIEDPEETAQLGIAFLI
jgi:GntR family transcriptional regulator